MSSLIVEISEIVDVQDHPNADRLELATVRGWQCVVQKGAFRKGDRCLYIPIDSVLPPEVEATIFPSDSKVKLSKSRVKTIKLRGAISQGLVVPLELFPSIATLSVGTDVKDLLGISKYQPPVSSSPQSKCLQKSKKQCNPHFREYTDLENIKNYPNVFTEEDIVAITEKIHGTNFRAGWVPSEPTTLWKKILKFFGLLPRYEFVYGSHYVQLQDKPKNHTGYYDTNVYLEAVEKYNLRDIIPLGYVVYGEVYGDGIQKGYMYGCKPGERKLAVFDIFEVESESYLDFEHMSELLDLEDLPQAPVDFIGRYYPGLPEELATYESHFPNTPVREGVVMRPLQESKAYMGRKILKCINPEYYLRDNSEHH